MQIVVSQWYDTVSDESASNGDYKSTGNDIRSFVFDLDEIDLACHQFESILKNMSYDDELRVGEVVYGVDPDTDYTTGDQHYDRLIIDVIDNDTVRNKTYKRLRAEIQAFLDTI